MLRIFVGSVAGIAGVSSSVASRRIVSLTASRFRGLPSF
jgi:hypothetical protein